MLQVQTFLETHSFKDLYHTYGVAARSCKDGLKWSLNYDQIDAKPGCAVASQCRGLILRPVVRVASDSEIVGPTTIVARPMDRFYNAGDFHAAEIDWSTARIQEKLDGTMCILYFDDVKNEWCVATRSVPEADVSFGDPPGSPLNENTFAELFKYAVNCTHPWTDFIRGLDTNYTYVFELTSPLNRVVVKYDDYEITLLSIRNTSSGEDVLPDVLEEYLQVVTEWPLTTLPELTEFVNQMDPAKCEGAIVVDGNFNRVKVKSKAWVLASRAKDAVLHKRGALECIINGSAKDVMPFLDVHVTEYLKGMNDSFDRYMYGVDVAFKRFNGTCLDRKDFALAVQASGLWQTPFFILYAGKYTNCLDWLRQLSKTGKLTNSVLDSLLQQIDK